MIRAHDILHYHGVIAATEPGYRSSSATERAYRAAAALIQRKLDHGSGSWLKNVGIGKHRVDVSVVESLDHVYEPRNLIPLVLEVVYSDISSNSQWNELRRQFGYSTRTHQVYMGIAGGGAVGGRVVPAGGTAQAMLQSIMQTYVDNVREF